jgi:alpha-glucosidase
MIRLPSPAGNVEFQLGADDPRLQFSVTFGGRPVIEPSPMAFSVDGVDLAEGAEVTGQEPFELSESYPWRGVHAQAYNWYSGAVVSLRHRGSGTDYRLEVRVFHDGAAFRWIVPGGAEARVPEEATRFVLPAGSTVWYHDFEGHYEGVHQKKEIDDVQEGEWVAPPLTIQLPWRPGYAAITEAALVNFAGMGLQADG